MSTLQKELPSIIQTYLKEGEEARSFSYVYRDQENEYQNIYYFDRKKGAYAVLGFLVLDQSGQAAERSIAEEVNASFNLYNYVFKRFREEWGAVVQQDTRKYVAANEHLKLIVEYYEQHKAEIPEEIFQTIISYLEVIEHVLACQDKFLDLDLDVIEIGRKKTEQQGINPELMQELKALIKEFEFHIFDQIDIQNTSQEIRDRFVAYFSEKEPPKEIKRSVKKALKMSKRMDKLIAKHKDKLLERKQDTTNEKHYQELRAQWDAMLRNE